MIRIYQITERKDFCDTWLFESPEVLEFSAWEPIRNEISEFCLEYPEKIREEHGLPLDSD